MIVGWVEDIKDYMFPAIVYSDIEWKDKYFDKDGDRGIKDGQNLALRAYNYHYVDKEVKLFAETFKKVQNDTKH